MSSPCTSTVTDFGSHVTKLALLGWAAEASAAEKVLAVAAAKSGEDNDDDSLQRFLCRGRHGALYSYEIDHYGELARKQSPLRSCRRRTFARFKRLGRRKW